MAALRTRSHSIALPSTNGKPFWIILPRPRYIYHLWVQERYFQTFWNRNDLYRTTQYSKRLSQSTSLSFNECKVNKSHTEFHKHRSPRLVNIWIIIFRDWTCFVYKQQCQLMRLPRLLEYLVVSKYLRPFPNSPSNSFTIYLKETSCLFWWTYT